MRNLKSFISSAAASIHLRSAEYLAQTGWDLDRTVLNIAPGLDAQFPISNRIDAIMIIIVIGIFWIFSGLAGFLSVEVRQGNILIIVAFSFYDGTIGRVFGEIVTYDLPLLSWQSLRRKRRTNEIRSCFCSVI